jgi:hypothetical protein
MSFWSNKPLKLNSGLKNDNTYILDSDSLLLNINTEISNSKFSLDYYIVTSPDDFFKTQLLEFINNNYNGIDSKFTLNYSKELFNHYITPDTLCILFYPYNKKPSNITTQNMVGFICGHPEIIYIKENNTFKQYKTIDVNYLCLIKSIRNLHFSSYMINILTKRCLLKFNKQINCALYTIGGKPIKTPSFSNKTFYHRPINVENLTDSKLLLLDKDICVLKQMFQTFDFDKNFLKNYKFIHLTKRYLDKNQDVLTNIVNEIHDKLFYINQINYDIFDYKSKHDIRNILLNDSFYNFLIINPETNEIKDFICLYNLITKNTINNISSRNGYFYIFMTLENDTYKFNLIEYISKYSFENDLFDMITVMDIMENGYLKDKHFKILNSSTKLYYYMYNLQLSQIEPFKNGLITI